MRITELTSALQAALGPAAVIVHRDALATYAGDASMISARPPELVALPATPAQAALCVRLAQQHGVPIIARGAGTGIAGGAVPLNGGLVISTARLNQIESIDQRMRRALVGAGVVNGDLNAQLAPLGLHFAPDPSSQRASTIGGNLATNAGGPHCLKYGVTTNHVLAVEFVDQQGELLWSDRTALDLTGLLVGSEGTLGLVTRAIVRLTPLPEAVQVVLALFPEVIAATSAVSKIIAAGLLPTSLEVMDYNAIRAVNGAYGLGLPEGEGVAALIVEVDGVAEGLDAALAAVLEICRAEGAFELRPARSAEERNQIWLARKSVAGAIGRLAPAYYLVDTVVPRTRLATMMRHVERLRHELKLEVCNVFHAGDGNLHPLVLYDPHNADQTARAHQLAEEVLRLSIAEGGVVSGEHGIGLEKREFLAQLLSHEELALHATIASVFDPHGQANPAKIFPLEPQQSAKERQARLLASRSNGGLEQLMLVLEASLGSARIVRGSEAVPYAIGGVVPPLVLSPAHPSQAAQAVAACSQAGFVVVPWGDGSHRSSLHAPAAPFAVLSLRCLDRVLNYEPDDQTIMVEAGMSLAALNSLLARHGQQLPIDVLDPVSTTIGGLIAVGSEGPRTLGYGSLRDWVLGLTVIEPDGVIVRLGAQVVKNVSGYDLPKLYVGSGGRLGLIIAAALRVFPLPPASATLLATGALSQLCALADAVAASRLLPTAMHLVASNEQGFQLAMRSEGSAAVVARHAAEFGQLAAAHRVGVSQLEQKAERAWWSQIGQIALPNALQRARIQRNLSASDLQQSLAALLERAEAYGLTWRYAWRAFDGRLELQLNGPAAHAVAAEFRQPSMATADSRANALANGLRSAIDPGGVFAHSPLPAVALGRGISAYLTQKGN